MACVSQLNAGDDPAIPRVVVIEGETLGFRLPIPHLPHEVWGELVEILAAFVADKILGGFRVFDLDGCQVRICAEMNIEKAVVVHEEPFHFGRKGVGDLTSIKDRWNPTGFLPHFRDPAPSIPKGASHQK
jgi:hypothetical protein